MGNQERIIKILLIEKMNNIFRNLDEEKFKKTIFCLQKEENTVSALISENEEYFFSLDVITTNVSIQYYLEIRNFTKYRFLISENDIEKIETISWIKKFAI